MFDNIQSANNSRTVNADSNSNLFEDSYSKSEKSLPTSSAVSQFASWTQDEARFKIGGDNANQMLSVPSLELTDFADLRRGESRAFDSERTLVQASTETETRSAKMLENLTKYAGDNNLAISNLDAVGINFINKSWQNVFDNCPKNGEVKQTESGGQLTGMTTFGRDGQKVAAKTGEDVDRYFKNDDGFYCHAHTVNTMGAPGELERVMETENHTKIYVHNQLPANGAVRIDVLLPDGKSGVQIDANSLQLKDFLKQIKAMDKEQTATTSAS